PPPRAPWLPSPLRDDLRARRNRPDSARHLESLGDRSSDLDLSAALRTRASRHEELDVPLCSSYRRSHDAVGGEPRSFECITDRTENRSPYIRVRDHSALADRGPSGLELRLDQYDEPSLRRRQRCQRGDDRTE